MTKDSFKFRWLQRLKVYKTHGRIFIVGSDIAQTKFRIVTVDRNEPTELIINEDDVEYDAKEINDIISSLHDGNNGGGKWKKSSIESFDAYGIVGFVRFLEGYYAIFITEQSKIAEIGCHSIYKIEDTSMVYLPNQSVRLAHPDEARYMKMFQTVDLSSDFYFSYSYDLTNSLQHNMIYLHNLETSSFAENTDLSAESEISAVEKSKNVYSPCKRFIWNNYLIEHPVSDSFKSLWLLRMIHGHVTQRCINVYGQQIYITLIARRSSSYAGTRFMKRGCNVKGEVANEVETEQIVHCASISSMRHAPFTSYVQHRGSVPLHWEQDISANVVPSKPPITITNDNPYAQATACHFRQLFERFGAPVMVLNLVRKRERRFRESILGHEYKCAVDYLNQFLKTSQQIKFFAIDMAQLSRGRKPTVLAKLANVAEYALISTGFFQSKPELFQDTLSQNIKWKSMGGTRMYGYRLQTGVLRTNCVDCLDRTNSAQFIAGKCALAYQLFSLGVLPEPEVCFDTDVIRLYEAMFEDHGDTIALQYGGSQLVHTIQSYRRTVAPWASHSRDIVTTISRYYTNTFSDADKQAAMNLFLGVFRPSKFRDNLWDISTDHYLHNRDPDVLASFFTSNYTRWWNPDVFRVLPLPYDLMKNRERLKEEASAAFEEEKSDEKGNSFDWFNDLHKPFELTFFDDVFALNMPSTYSRFLSTGHHDASPFVIRKEMDQDKEPSSHVPSPVPSQTSLDLSSNDSSESDVGDEDHNLQSSDFLNSSFSHSPWLRKPTLEDFSPKTVYGIDLDNCTLKEDVELYEKYLTCIDVDERIFECDSDTVLVEEPTVDGDSLLLYKESVHHTYEPDRQFYEAYLTSYAAF